MTATSNHRRHAPGGFTLIELMVVLAILALLAGMVAPSVAHALRRTGIEARGEDVMALLRFARSYAITSHHPVQANFDSQRGRCWVSAITTPLPWVEREAARAPERIGAVQLPRTIRIALQQESAAPGGGAWQTLTFKSDGRADNALLRLMDDQGAVFDIQVIGTDGSVHRPEEFMQ